MMSARVTLIKRVVYTTVNVNLYSTRPMKPYLLSLVLDCYRRSLVYPIVYLTFFAIVHHSAMTFNGPEFKTFPWFQLKQTFGLTKSFQAELNNELRLEYILTTKLSLEFHYLMSTGNCEFYIFCFSELNLIPQSYVIGTCLKPQAYYKCLITRNNNKKKLLTS
ncbi:hypothetical protein BLOT_009291 [Blomia tropicalis]|nr:hypothetical protein BLOT_009291 [Blomia tropicalis]